MTTNNSISTTVIPSFQWAIDQLAETTITSIQQQQMIQFIKTLNVNYEHFQFQQNWINSIDQIVEHEWDDTMQQLENMYGPISWVNQRKLQQILICMVFKYKSPPSPSSLHLIDSTKENTSKKSVNATKENAEWISKFEKFQNLLLYVLFLSYNIYNLGWAMI